MRPAWLLLTFVALAGAQSFYNAQGLGELSPVPDARIAATGGSLALSPANPGGLVHLDKVGFNLSVRGGATIGSNAVGSRGIPGAAPSGLAVAAPLPAGFRIFGGAAERFNQDFDIWSESLPDTAYRRHVIGRGGVYSLQAGLAKSFFDRVCIGAAYSHLLGGSREQWRFEINNSTYTAVDTVEIDFSGNSFAAGLSYQDRQLTAAAVVHAPVALLAERYRLVHGAVSESVRTALIALPYSLHLGAAFAPTGAIQLSAGFDWRPWSSTTIRIGDGLAADAGYRDVWDLSLGAEYELAEGHPVRTGFARREWYYQPVLDGERSSVIENAVTVGTGIAVPRLGSLDLAGRVGLRTAAGLHEVTAGLALTLAYQEPWSRRTRRWGY
jgi:hypothetical protein